MATSAALVFAGKSVATPAISFLVNKAFNYLNKYCKSEGMEEVKNRLLQAMPKIQAVFDVINPERIREQSSALDAWLWQLRDAVEEAEDAIDELEYYELEEKAKDQKELYMRCDSELEKKSREHRSPEWNKISHIRKVILGGSYFIMGQECSKETFEKLR